MPAAEMILTPRGLHFCGRWFPCSVGRGGVTADKREGDGATPCGRHSITGMFYRADRIARPAAWAIAVGPQDLWSDDPGDPAYNTWVRGPHEFSHEVLRRADPMYDLVLTTDWNWPEGQPGRGSAIFVHQWRRRGYPTAGCVGLPREALRWIAPRAVPGTVLEVRFGAS